MATHKSMIAPQLRRFAPAPLPDLQARYLDSAWQTAALAAREDRLVRRTNALVALANTSTRASWPGYWRRSDLTRRHSRICLVQDALTAIPGRLVRRTNALPEAFVVNTPARADLVRRVALAAGPDWPVGRTHALSVLQHAAAAADCNLRNTNNTSPDRCAGRTYALSLVVADAATAALLRRTRNTDLPGPDRLVLRTYAIPADTNASAGTQDFLGEAVTAGPVRLVRRTHAGTIIVADAATRAWRWWSWNTPAAGPHGRVGRTHACPIIVANTATRARRWRRRLRLPDDGADGASLIVRRVRVTGTRLPEQSIQKCLIDLAGWRQPLLALERAYRFGRFASRFSVNWTRVEAACGECALNVAGAAPAWTRAAPTQGNAIVYAAGCLSGQAESE